MKNKIPLINDYKLIREVSSYTKIPIYVVEKVIKSLKETIIDNLRNDTRVNLVGFGTFEPFIRHERKGINPNNPTQKMTIGEVRIAKFRSGNKMKLWMKKRPLKSQS